MPAVSLCCFGSVAFAAARMLAEVDACLCDIGQSKNMSFLFKRPVPLPGNPGYFYSSRKANRQFLFAPASEHQQCGTATNLIQVNSRHR